MERTAIRSKAQRPEPKQFIVKVGMVLVTMAMASMAFALCNPPQGSGCRDCLYQPPNQMGGQGYTYDFDPMTGQEVTCSSGPCTPFTC